MAILKLKGLVVDTRTSNAAEKVNGPKGEYYLRLLTGLGPVVMEYGDDMDGVYDALEKFYDAKMEDEAERKSGVY